MKKDGLDNTGATDTKYIQLQKEEEIKFNKDCPGWDVDASEDGQFIVNCEHKECNKE